MIEFYLTVKNAHISKSSCVFHPDRPIYLLHLSDVENTDCKFLNIDVKDIYGNYYIKVVPKDVDEESFLNRNDINITFEVYSVIHNGKKVFRAYFTKDSIETVKGEDDGVHET